MFEFVTTSALCAVLAYLLLARRNRWEWLGIFVVGPILLTLGLALLAFYTEAPELMPALKDVWLLIHVTVAILAVALFTIAFSVGVRAEQNTYEATTSNPPRSIVTWR